MLKQSVKKLKCWLELSYNKFVLYRINNLQIAFLLQFLCTEITAKCSNIVGQLFFNNIKAIHYESNKPPLNSSRRNGPVIERMTKHHTKLKLAVAKRKPEKNQV